MQQARTEVGFQTLNAMRPAHDMQHKGESGLSVQRQSLRQTFRSFN
jgi:hypothetical protein